MESRKRKPLSDLTNTYNLIPTSTLRKLVASSNSNSFPKPPISIVKSNASSTNQKFCSDSSNRSDTSIGSSNVSGARNSRTGQFRTPPSAISSITSPGGIGSKDAAYNRRQTIEKSNEEREPADVIVSPTPVEKRKDKGKTIAVPFSSSPPEKTKENKNEICNPCSPLERKRQKDEANLSLFSGPVEMVKESSKRIGKTEKGKAILNSSGCSMGKTDEIGKVIANHSGCSLEKTKDGKKGILEKTREKGKAILHSSNIVDITNSKGSSAAMQFKCAPPRRKNDAGASSCPPVIRTKNIRSDLDEAGATKSSKSWTDLHPKCRKKRCSKIDSTAELPLDFIEQQRAYFKEVDEFELPVEETSQDDLD